MPKNLQYRSGSFVYFKGDPANQVFILQQGKVNLTYQDIETNEDQHDPVQPGEFFGVKSALGHYPREENAVAVQDAVVIAFTVPEFETLAAANTRIIMKMLKVFSGQLRRLHRQVSGLVADKTDQPPEDGLYNIGKYYLKNKRYYEAAYVFGRYLNSYPSGIDSAQAAKDLQTAEKNMGKFPRQQASPPPVNQSSGQASAQGFGEAFSKAFSRFSRTFKAGEMIFSEFENGGAFYLIQTGRVQLVKITGDMERTLDIINPSDMFGEMAILENSPRSATAIALDEVTVLEFNSENFETLMLGNPQIALKLLKMFTKRIYESKRRFMILTLDEPQAKVADVFLMLDETIHDIDRTTESRDFFITVEGAAHWAGMSVNQTRDILGHMITQRRVEVYQDHILVRNINDFQRYVGTRRKNKQS